MRSRGKADTYCCDGVGGSAYSAPHHLSNTLKLGEATVVASPTSTPPQSATRGSQTPPNAGTDSIATPATPDGNAKRKSAIGNDKRQTIAGSDAFTSVAYSVHRIAALHPHRPAVPAVYPSPILGPALHVTLDQHPSGIRRWEDGAVEHSQRDDHARHGASGLETRPS